MCDNGPANGHVRGRWPRLSAATSGPRAVVRVNQVGYRPGDAKRAVLLSTVSEAGARFAVVNTAGATILRGRVGAALPAWSGRYRFARAIDFSAARAAGGAHIVVTGPARAASPRFRVGTQRGVVFAAGAKRGAVLPVPAGRAERDRKRARPAALPRQRRARGDHRRAGLPVRLADRRPSRCSAGPTTSPAGGSTRATTSSWCTPPATPRRCS